MKALKTLVAIALSTVTLGSAVAIGVAAGSDKVIDSAEAATATTVYYAVPSNVVGSYTVKLNINRKGDGSDWATYTMSRDGTKTYKGKYLYKATYTDLYDGVGCMQFQLYQGSTWKGQQEPINTWTGVSTYNGKIYEHATGWKDYDYDETKTIYLNTYDWGSLYVHIWDSGNSSSDTTWPGASVSFTDSNLRFNGENNKLQAYTFTGLHDATKFLYQSAADTNKSDDFSATSGAYYWHNGKAWVKDTGDLASAAKYVWDFNTARLAVSGSGNVKPWSICGLNLSSWYSKYNSLTATAKGYVNAASIWTYKDASSSDADTRVTFAEIVEYMAHETSLGSRNIILSFEDNKHLYTVIIIVSTLMISTVGLYFFIRKKRKYHN